MKSLIKKETGFIKLFNLKKSLFPLSFVLVFLFSFEELSSEEGDTYFYNGDERQELRLNNERMLVKFHEGTPVAQMYQTLKDISSKYVENFSKEDLENNWVSFVELKEPLSYEEILSRKNKFEKKDHVRLVNPTYWFNSQLVGITSRFVAKLNALPQKEHLENLVQEKSAEIIEQRRGPLTYSLRVTPDSDLNSLEMANYFYETGYFEYAHPTFRRIIKRHCVNDEFFDEQWNLENTGQDGGNPGSDIQMCDALEISEGREEIRVAVIDDGVDLGHPELQNSLVQGHDATDRNLQGDQENDDPHGTAVAGVIAADSDNNIGVAGIAPNISIIPIRMAFEDQNGDLQSDGDWVEEAFEWAWDDGNADIINFSWLWEEVADFEDAMEDAVNQGREGLGTMIFAPSGNHRENPNYPYDVDEVVPPASHPKTIAVGGINNEDIRIDDDDWDNSEGAHYGPNLDIVAPGDEIPTTDVSGPNGYSNDPDEENLNDDIVVISGTSFASPHAAGVMALILSENRCLSREEAIDILMLSTDKVSHYCYNLKSNRDHGGWNEEMGYGRVNAYEAVRFANNEEVHSFSGSGNVENVSDSYQWSLNAGGCSELADGIYIVERHTIEKTVNYPYTKAPVLRGRANGFSQANPNDGNYFMEVVELNETEATVRTHVYDVISTMSGQSLSWAPHSPSNVNFEFSIASALKETLYLQDQTLNSGDHSFYALDKIFMGEEVDDNQPYGPFIVEGDADVVAHGGHNIIIEEGTIINPGNDGSFKATTEPFFTCSEYPQGKRGASRGGSPTPTIEQEHQKETPEDIKEAYIKNYPNPFSETTTIEYGLANAGKTSISVFNVQGNLEEKVVEFNHQEEGVHYLEFEASDITPGVYIVTLMHPEGTKSSQMVIK